LAAPLSELAPPHSALFAPIATAVVLAIVIGVWAIVDGVFDTVCYAFANALSERGEAALRNLRSTDARQTLFQAGTANLNPANVATDNIRFGFGILALDALVGTLCSQLDSSRQFLGWSPRKLV
jgi:hypothetical protein